MAAEKNPFAKFLTHFKKGHVLFNEGDAGEDMFIIQSGKVAIKKRVNEGGDATLAVLEKGDFFGEMALLERLPRSATAAPSRRAIAHARTIGTVDSAAAVSFIAVMRSS